MVPQKSYEPKADLDFTLTRYARLFDLGAIGNKLGYPQFMKPYDGGGWKGVSRIKDEAALKKAYDESGTMVMASCGAPRVIVPVCCITKLPRRPFRLPLTRSIAAMSR